MPQLKKSRPRGEGAVMDTDIKTNKNSGKLVIFPNCQIALKIVPIYYKCYNVDSKCRGSVYEEEVSQKKIKQPKSLVTLDFLLF